MAMSSIGDLATSILFRGHNSRLKSEMETLVQELASGQVSIRDTSLGGSYRAVSCLCVINYNSLSVCDYLPLPVCV